MYGPVPPPTGAERQRSQARWTAVGETMANWVVDRLARKVGVTLLSRKG